MVQPCSMTPFLFSDKTFDNPNLKMLPCRSQVKRTKRKTPLELKLELASPKLSNEQLIKQNEVSNKINTLKLQYIKTYQLQVRGAHVSLTKLRKRLDLQRKSKAK